MVRLSPVELAALDLLISEQSDPKPTRPEAIRQALRALFEMLAKDPLRQKP